MCEWSSMRKSESDAGCTKGVDRRRGEILQRSCLVAVNVQYKLYSDYELTLQLLTIQEKLLFAAIAIPVVLHANQLALGCPD